MPLSIPKPKSNQQRDEAMQHIREWVRDGVVEPADIDLAVMQGYHMAEAITHNTTHREA